MGTDFVECRYCHEYISTDMSEPDICPECENWYRFFAGCALIGMMGNTDFIKNLPEPGNSKTLAAACYGQAGAMLAAREG